MTSQDLTVWNIDINSKQLGIIFSEDQKKVAHYIFEREKKSSQAGEVKRRKNIGHIISIE